MVLNQCLKTGRKVVGVVIFLVVMPMSIGCRETRIHVTPERPKQGDLIYIAVDNEERDEVARVDVTYADRVGWGDGVPAYFTMETCKDTEPYLTALDIHAVTTYVDGATGTKDRHVDLTCGAASTEDDDLHYVLYVTQDSDEEYRDQAIDMAAAFTDEFDAYSRSQYYWAEPSLYTSACSSYANSADLTISFGHGLHHTYYTGVGDVDLSTTGYGNFRPCAGHGDAEYLVFFSCLTLSLEDHDGHGWRYFWANNSATQSELRPFSGLHMVMGFRTVVQTRCFFGCNGEDLFEEFAANLDSGDRVVDAWQEAVGDELSFSDGYNRGTVIYLPEYVDDTIHSVGDDYIYGNSRYRLVADYWE